MSGAITTPNRTGNGITYEQVAAIAETMIAAGVEPTQRTVRAQLGDTGSWSTIIKHLTAWKSLRERKAVKPPSLHPAIEKAIIDEIEKRIAEARAALEKELVGANTNTDLLVNESAEKTLQVEEYARELADLNALCQQHVGTIEQLRADISAAKEAIVYEQKTAETARRALALADMRLESLPRIEAEIDRLRASIESEKAAHVASDQISAVLRAKLEGTDAALAEARDREQQIAARLAVVEKNNQILVNEAKDLQAQLHAAVVEIAKVHEQGRQSLEMKAKREKLVVPKRLEKNLLQESTK